MSTLSLLAAGGLAFVLSGWVVYMATVPGGRVPRVPSLALALQAAGVLLSGFAIVAAVTGDASVAGPIALGSLAMLLTAFFVVLLFLRPTPLGAIQIRVGHRLPPFELQDAEGKWVRSNALRGQWTLIKVFRGHWCPYCAAELKRHEMYKDEFAARGVEVIGLSKDTVDDAATHRRRDGLTMRLLCDPQLDVIRRYGLEHHKALQITGPMIKLGPISLGLVPSFKTMAIPTSILVDDHGVIRWIEQAADYGLRTLEEDVLRAIDLAQQSRAAVQ